MVASGLLVEELVFALVKIVWKFGKLERSLYDID